MKRAWTDEEHEAVRAACQRIERVSPLVLTFPSFAMGRGSEGWLSYFEEIGLYGLAEIEAIAAHDEAVAAERMASALGEADTT